MKNLSLLFAFALLTLQASAGETIKFESLDPAHLYHMSGELYMPANVTDPVPAMVVVHGTGGVDERTDYFAKELPKMGVAAFVVDYKSGNFTNPTDRPSNDSFIGASFAALKLLESRSAIKSDKIGIMGFSLGGQQTLSTTLQKYKVEFIGTDAPGFKVHIAFYPGCRYFLKKIKEDTKIVAPLEVFWGTKDSYGDGDACPKMADALANATHSELKLVPFEGASHGFDGIKTGYFKEPAISAPRAYIESNPVYGVQARKQALEFIDKYLLQ